jgi:deoxycytidylate deaminase
MCNNGGEDPDLPSYFRLAKNASKHSEHKIKVGAVLVDGSRVISVGFNKIKYNGRFETKWDTTHAEISALMTSGKRNIKNATIYVYREKRNGTIGMARPCEYCQQSLKDFGVKTMIYTIENYPYFETEKL